MIDSKPSTINETIARALGWTYDGLSWQSPKQQGTNWHDIDVPYYCDDIKAAWEVVDYLLKKGYSVDLDADKEGYRFFIHDHIGPEVFALAATAPMAICIACLKLKSLWPKT